MNCPPYLTVPMVRELSSTGFAVRTGKVWTTDAPYRETNTQLGKWAREGALAVEMQAASLFAFGYVGSFRAIRTLQPKRAVCWICMPVNGKAAR